jgi:hypothetical protein
MTNQHPITPPPELVEQWFSIWEASDQEEVSFAEFAVSCAVQYGADQELEAICAWLCEMPGGSVMAEEIRAARRPKPPTLKEQALTALRQVGNCEEINNATFETIRTALEALPND